jgi:hypothetical protein
MGSKYRLTEQAFQELKEKLAQRKGSSQYTDENIDLARKIMVDGKGPNDVAEEAKKSRQSIHRIVKDLWVISAGDDPARIKKRRETENIPDDWVFITAVLPPDLAKDVRAKEKEALKKLKTTEQK